jgi:hypothetical protein
MFHRTTEIFADRHRREPNEKGTGLRRSPFMKPME